MKLKIYDAKGKATDKSVNLSKDVFGIEPNDHAIYLDVKQHLDGHTVHVSSDLIGQIMKINYSL